MISSYNKFLLMIVIKTECDNTVIKLEFIAVNTTMIELVLIQIDVVLNVC